MVAVSRRAVSNSVAQREFIEGEAARRGFENLAVTTADMNDFASERRYDRVLSVNMFGTKVVLLLSVIAFLGGRPDFLDLALAYALINFIGVLAVLEFFKSRAARRSAEHNQGKAS